MTPKSNQQTTIHASPSEGASAGSSLPADQGDLDTHGRCVDGDLNDRASHKIRAPHADGADAVPNVPADQSGRDTHDRCVDGDLDDPTANVGATSIERARSGRRAGQRDHHAGDTQGDGVSLFDPTLSVLAEALDDAEQVRKSQANRLRTLTATGVDKDGVVRGHGLPEDHPAVMVLVSQVDALEALDRQLTRALEKQLKGHALGPWVQASRGLGLKTIARLLAAVGDPYWHDRDQRPRTVGELFAFCGVAGPGYVKRRGEPVRWNPTARMRLWNIVQPIIKTSGPYRDVYDAGRARYADAVHSAPCVRCGPAGHPAAEGSPLSAAHQHARATRLVMREVLRDLWAEAKRIHEPDGSSQGTHDSQCRTAAVVPSNGKDR